jgi:hypothetical protein
MKYRQLLPGAVTLTFVSLGLVSLGLVTGSAFGSPQPVADPSPEPTSTSATGQCDAPASPDPSPTSASPDAPSAPAMRLVSARLAAAPGDTIVLTIDLKTGLFVKDESSAHFDNANTYVVQFHDDMTGHYVDVYYTLPDGKFCAPSVMLADGTLARQNGSPKTKAPKGFTKVIALGPGVEAGKIVIKWVQTRP